MEVITAEKFVVWLLIQSLSSIPRTVSAIVVFTVTLPCYVATGVLIIHSVQNIYVANVLNVVFVLNCM